MATPGSAIEAQPGCFVCGEENSRGLHISFARDPDGVVTAHWTASSAYEGFRGIIHGGIIATLLDEAMSQAVYQSGMRALTCELRVRLRRHVEPGEQLGLRGWIVEKKRRKVTCEAALTDAEGGERAHAWGVFLAV